MKNSHNPKTMIKAKFSNDVHAQFEKWLNVTNDKNKPQWQIEWDRRNALKKFSDSDKARMFETLFEMHEATSKELVNYLQNKRFKKKVNKLRAEKRDAQQQEELKRQLEEHKAKILELESRIK